MDANGFFCVYTHTLSGNMSRVIFHTMNGQICSGRWLYSVKETTVRKQVLFGIVDLLTAGGFMLEYFKSSRAKVNKSQLKTDKNNKELIRFYSNIRLH